LKIKGDELQILHAFASVIFILTLIGTLTSVKEIPFVLHDEFKQEDEENKSANLHRNKSFDRNEITKLPEEVMNEQDEDEYYQNEIKIANGNKITNENDENDDEEDDDDDDDDDMDKPIDIKMIYKSVTKVNEHN
jgi:hypothetical protein